MTPSTTAATSTAAAAPAPPNGQEWTRSTPVQARSSDDSDISTGQVGVESPNRQPSTRHLTYKPRSTLPRCHVPRSLLAAILPPSNLRRAPQTLASPSATPSLAYDPERPPSFSARLARLLRSSHPPCSQPPPSVPPRSSCRNLARYRRRARHKRRALPHLSTPPAAHESLSTGFASAPPSSPPGQSLTRTRAEPRADAAIAVPRLSSPLARHLRRAFAADSALPPLAPAAAEDDLEPQCGNAASHAPCSARPRRRAARDGYVPACPVLRSWHASSATSSPTRTHPAQATTGAKTSPACAIVRSLQRPISRWGGGMGDGRRGAGSRHSSSPAPAASVPAAAHARPLPAALQRRRCPLGTSPALRTQLAQAATTAETSRDRGGAPVAAAIPRREELWDCCCSWRRRSSPAPAASVPAAAHARPLPAALQRRRLSSRAQQTALNCTPSPLLASPRRRRTRPVPPAASAPAAAYARRVPAALQRRRLSLKRLAQSRTASNRRSSRRRRIERIERARRMALVPRPAAAALAPRPAAASAPSSDLPAARATRAAGRDGLRSPPVASPRLARPVAPPPRMPRAARDVPSANPRVGVRSRLRVATWHGRARPRARPASRASSPLAAAPCG
ncbi:hypothetical protein B0H15DRAFT_998336 [Mycena belliarum]|uniref:Uncharacterized protein n=1 Tax=Mycena belliarum TaxID=1033014 RepID=A0AAD6TTY4_9AGAR|nr:hypothetical protein B0H15DRAFT_998336 [Mycena belliae]